MLIRVKDRYSYPLNLDIYGNIYNSINNSQLHDKSFE